MTQLDPRRWFDKMQPQTLQIATLLLYLNGFFALVSVLDEKDYLGYLRQRFGLGALIGILVVVAYVGGGFLMANDRKIGYKCALVAAFSPFILRFWALSDLENHFGGSISVFDKITGGDTIGFLFEVALCALLLHPHSRDHQKLWFH